MLLSVKKIIPLLVFILLATSVSAIDHYYNISLSYDKGIISSQSIDIIPSQIQPKLQSGLFLAEVVSLDSQTLNLTFFDFPLTLIVDLENGLGRVIKLNQAEINLYVPYYQNAKEIIIYDEELNKQLSLDVSYYSKEKPKETTAEELLPQAEVERQQRIKTYSLTSIIIIVLIIIALIFFLKLKKSKD